MTTTPEKKDVRRTLLSTLVLLTAMITKSPRKEEEKAAAPVLESLFDPKWVGSEIFVKYKAELQEKGYLDDQGNPTPWGQKVALEATHNAPDYTKIAQGNVNASFAMFFAAIQGFKTHLKTQIQPGGKTDLYERMSEAKSYINDLVE
jgi:hypothetical protein